MVLPLYLAMTGAETAAAPSLPPHWCYMACHFSPDGSGLCDLSGALPPGTMVILNDRFPCRDHDPQQIAAELGRLKCGSVLLDFERKPQEYSRMVADALFRALRCPVAAPPGFIEDKGCAVFLPPCPLHVPLAEYFRPWQGREIWLEAALQQQTITVTPQGTQYGPILPADNRAGGFFDDILKCQCVTDISDAEVHFNLFDTRNTLARKLALAAELGAVRAVGLWQELGK